MIEETVFHFCVQQLELKVQSIVRLSDCYIFPTLNSNKTACIEIPLSVLEAASCNLPIVSTEFGALPEIFKGVSGFFFAQSEKQVIHVVRGINGDNIEIDTREKASLFSWEIIACELDKLYKELSCGWSG